MKNAIDPNFVKTTVKATRQATELVWGSETLRTALIYRDAARVILSQIDPEFDKAKAIIRQFMDAANEIDGIK